MWYFHVFIWYIIGVLQKRKWENAMTVDKRSWGYRRDANLASMLTMEELIGQLAGTVRYGQVSLIEAKLLPFRIRGH